MMGGDAPSFPAIDRKQGHCCAKIRRSDPRASLAQSLTDKRIVFASRFVIPI
jgi:hypothetical protein